MADDWTTVVSKTKSSTKRKNDDTAPIKSSQKKGQSSQQAGYLQLNHFMFELFDSMQFRTYKIVSDRLCIYIILN